MTNVISIDPGRKCFTLARWGAGELLEVLPLTATYVAGPSLLNPAMSGSQQLSILANHYATQGRGPADVAVVERMVHYPGQRKDSRAAELAKASDLLELQALGAYVAGRIAREVAFISAAEWKGQAPKDVTTLRVVRELSESELATLQRGLNQVPKALAHNLYDAVGIGLKFAGRLRTGR